MGFWSSSGGLQFGGNVCLPLLLFFETERGFWSGQVREKTRVLHSGLLKPENYKRGSKGF